MKNRNLSITFKAWLEGKACYKPKRIIGMENNPNIELGGVLISIDDEPPIIDPLDKSRALILRKIVNRPNKLHIYEQRTYFKKPRLRIVGETIMCKSEFFIFQTYLISSIFKYTRGIRTTTQKCLR